MKLDKRILILTIAGTKVGFGHLMRCIAISTQFKKYNFYPEFIINSDVELNTILKNEKFKIFDWQNKNINLKDYSYTLLDVINCKDKRLQEIENNSNTIIFLDDDKRKNILNSGFVVDWTILSEKKNYFEDKRLNVTYLLGSKYIVLQDAFENIKQININNDVKNILVTLGGSDIRNLMPKILKTLTGNFAKMNKFIVIGPGFNNIDEIKKYQDNNTFFIKKADAFKMAQLMQKSDVAIATGGQTLYELAKIGVPTIGILVVDNATDDTLGWSKVGFLDFIGWYNDNQLLTNLINSINKLKDKHIREKMQDQTKNYISDNKLLVQRILENGVI